MGLPGGPYRAVGKLCKGQGVQATLAPIANVTNTDIICQASQQEVNTTYALQAFSNDQIILRAQENGHITKPHNQQGNLYRVEQLLDYV